MKRRDAFVPMAFLAGAIARPFACGAEPGGKIRFAGEKWFLNSLVKTNRIPEFERQTGIAVEIIYRDHQDVLEDLSRATSSGGAYDLVLMRHRFLGSLVDRQLVQPIDSYVTDRALRAFDPAQQLFEPWWREISCFNNHVYGYPYTLLTPYVCYRKDLLNNPAEREQFKKRYGIEPQPPRSWEMYLRLAEFFTRPEQDFYGTYIQGKRHIALWYEWLNFCYSFGGNILATDHGEHYGDIVVNSPQNVAATELYLSLLPFSPPDTLTYDWMGAQHALQQGRAFMGLLWNDQAPFLEDPKVSKVAGKIGYCLIPSAVNKPFSQLEGWTYLTPSGARRPREAFRFMEWALSQDVQIDECIQGAQSPRKSTYLDLRIKNLPFTQVFLDSVPVAKPKPTIAEGNRITDIIIVGLHDIVTRKYAAKRGLDAIARQIHSVLGTKAVLRYP